MEGKQTADNCKNGKNVYVVPTPLAKFTDAALLNMAKDSFCSHCTDAVQCEQGGVVVRKDTVHATRVRLVRCLRNDR
jgi:hypothetical protein